MSLLDFSLPVESEAIYPPPSASTDILRKPLWAGDVTHETSGFHARVGYWEWDLVYSHTDDITQVEEFCLTRQAGRGFLYQDTKNNRVSLQNLGSGDGDRRRFRLVHTIAKTDDIVMVEPIGWLDDTQPFQVFVDGSLLLSDRYVVSRDERGHPFGDHFLDFSTPPAEGQAVSVAMGYYFVVGFSDDQENFTRRLRDLNSVTLQSRPAARWAAPSSRA